MIGSAGGVASSVSPARAWMSPKYAEWYLSAGGKWGQPLDATTLKEDRKILQYLERVGFDVGAATEGTCRAYLLGRLSAGEVGKGRLNAISKALMRWLRFREGAEVKLPTWKEPDPKMKALSRDQVFLALGYRHQNVQQSARDRFVLALALTCGAEPGEVAPMNLEDVDVEQGGIHVNHPIKGHRRRFVPLPPTVLSHTKRPSFTHYLKYRVEAPSDPRALFTTCGSEIIGSRAKRRLSPEALTAVLQRVRRATGVPINWQVARHTFATNLLEAEFGERYVMHALGLTNMNHLPRYAEARVGNVVRRFRKLKGTDPFGTV